RARSVLSRKGDSSSLCRQRRCYDFAIEQPCNLGALTATYPASIHTPAWRALNAGDPYSRLAGTGTSSPTPLDLSGRGQDVQRGEQSQLRTFSDAGLGSSPTALTICDRVIVTRQGNASPNEQHSGTS